MQPDLKKKVLFAAHIPPPWTGQGMIHATLLQGRYNNVELLHLPMLFSKSSMEQGKFSFKKVSALVRLILDTLYGRFRHRARVLYFSPGGPTLSAVVRDAAYLLAVRWCMDATMLVYHSSGVAQYVNGLPWPARVPVRRAFWGVSIAIQMSSRTPPDGVALGAKSVLTIANGVADEAIGWFPRAPTPILRLLYVGLVCREKSVADLLLACRKLLAKGIALEVRIVGAFASDEEEWHLRRMAKEELQGLVHFTGALTGAAKQAVFREADVFCFPSFWRTETYPLVLQEAMCFGLPVVASRWRGIPDLVGEDGSCGTLVAPRDTEGLASALEDLARSPAKRERLGRNGRSRYEQYFTVSALQASYEEAFQLLVAPSNAAT